MRKLFFVLLTFCTCTLFAQQYPFSHGFATDLSGQVPAGWTGDVEVKSYHGLDDGKGLASKMGSTNNEDSIITPLIGPITAYSDLIFWYRVVDDFIYPSSPTPLSDMGKLEVFAMTDDTTGTLLKTIDGSNHITNLEFFKIELPVLNLNGQSIKLKFKCTYGSGAAYYYDIDSIKIRDGISPNGVTETQVTQLNIYPNPAKDYVIIDTRELLEESKLITYNIAGQAVLTQNLVPAEYTRVNTADLPAGFYVLQIISAGKNYSSKFAITK
jgi:hypothetical protein